MSAARDNAMAITQSLLSQEADAIRMKGFQYFYGSVVKQVISQGHTYNKAEVASTTREVCHCVWVEAGLSERPLQFFSQSKDIDDLQIGVPHWRKVLSNFWESPEPIEVGNRRYNTVEHAFQAAKYILCSTPEDIAKAEAQRFEVSGDIRAPSSAKRAGARRGMMSVGCALNIEKWAKHADHVMFSALAAKWKVDPLFREILLEAQRQKITLVHFERSSKNSYWGGGIRDGGVVVGRNRLGNMLMELTRAAPHAEDAGESSDFSQETNHQKREMEKRKTDQDDDRKKHRSF